MKPQTLTLRHVALVMALIAAINIAPLLLFSFGGDIMFHYVVMACFSHQFWSGDLYPRWCFEANAGLGSPVLIFYGPLPYYISAIFYPLTHLGLTIENLYLLCAWLASLAAGITAWLWLRDITTPGKALLVAVIYLYLPYRLEVLLFRSAYSELWCLAFLPLAFKYARRLAQGDNKALPWLALAFALSLLSNLPCAMIGLLASGAYVLMLSPKALPRYVLALLWAAALTAFYLVPGFLYKHFVTTEGVISGQRSWSNDFLSWDNVTLHGQGHVVAAEALMLLAAAGLLLVNWHKRAMIGERFSRRELGAWAAIFLCACFLLFPISKPLWSTLPLMSLLIFPWRVQAAIALALAYGLALRLHWLTLPRQMKTWKGDFSMLMGLLILLSLFLVSARPPQFTLHGQEIEDSGYITQREYRTIWTDKPFIAMDYILKRYHNRADIPAVRVVSGAAEIGIRQWNADGIVLAVEAKKPSLLKLKLTYFPVWHVEPQNVVALPEEHSGQMLLKAPAGNYTIRLTARICEIRPRLVDGAYILSALAAAGLLLAFYSSRPFTKK